MKTSIIWAELHSPIFIAGTNLSSKLDPSKRTGLEMEYCEDKRHLYVTYNGKTSRIPEASVLSMVEGKVVPKAKPAVAAAPNKLTKAQVSGPHDHVFAGLGAGKDGVNEALRKL